MTGGRALRVCATPGALSVGSIAQPKSTPMHAPQSSPVTIFSFLVAFEIQKSFSEKNLAEEEDETQAATMNQSANKGRGDIYALICYK